mgnify:CR=1 FL=1
MLVKKDEEIKKLKNLPKNEENNSGIESDSSDEEKKKPKALLEQNF